MLDWLAVIAIGAGIAFWVFKSNKNQPCAGCSSCPLHDQGCAKRNGKRNGENDDER